MNVKKGEFTQENANAVAQRLIDKGFKAKVTTLKHPGMGAFADSEESVRGYSVAVVMDKTDVPMQKSYGYRSAGEYPGGFAWSPMVAVPGKRETIQLVPYPGDTLENFADKIETITKVTLETAHA